MAMNDMFFLSPAKNLQGIKWRYSGSWMLEAIYSSSLVRGTLDTLSPVKQVQERSRAETEVSCHAGELAIPLMRLSSSFIIRTSDSNTEVQNNSRITGFPAEGTVTVMLPRNLCCNSTQCGGYDQDIPAETHSFLSLYRVL